MLSDHADIGLWAIISDAIDIYFLFLLSVVTC